MADNQTYSNDRAHQTIIIKERRRTNGLGAAGFVLALIGFLLCWTPVLGWVIWLLGLLFSFIGLFKSPRGLAIAGFIISLVDFVFLIAVVGWLMIAIG